MAQYRLLGLSIIGLLLLYGCNYPVGRYSVLDSCYINTQGEGISLVHIEYTSYGGAIYVEPQELEYSFSGHGTSVARTYGG